MAIIMPTSSYEWKKRTSKSNVFKVCPAHWILREVLAVAIERIIATVIPRLRNAYGRRPAKPLLVWPHLQPKVPPISSVHTELPSSCFSGLQAFAHGVPRAWKALPSSP